MRSNLDLRNTLEAITQSHISAHDRLLSERVLNHTIRILSSIREDNSYNCVMYALDLQNDQRYLELRKIIDPNIHADTSFLNYLIDEGALLLDSSGNLLTYSNELKITHIGKIDIQGRVISKWGIGHLYEHAIYEVPISYGDQVRRYSLIENISVFWYFEAYLKNRYEKLT